MAWAKQNAPPFTSRSVAYAFCSPNRKDNFCYQPVQYAQK
jgi:YHS domain-containing protein